MIRKLTVLNDTQPVACSRHKTISVWIHYRIFVWIHHRTSSASHDVLFCRSITLGAASYNVIAICDDVVPGEERRQVDAVVKRLHEKNVFFSKGGDANVMPAVALQLLQNLLSASSYCEKRVWMLGEGGG
jgi:hypothetical protein